MLKSQKIDRWINTISFDDDAVKASIARMNTAFGYEDFVGITQDEDCYYLWRDQDYLLRVSRDSFTVGDAAGFGAFARQKIVEAEAARRQAAAQGAPEETMEK